MNVVNTLLAVARRAKDCGMAADIDAPPKIANAFIGLEEKFGKKFDHTSKVQCGYQKSFFDRVSLFCPRTPVSSYDGWIFSRIKL